MESKFTLRSRKKQKLTYEFLNLCVCMSESRWLGVCVCVSVCIMVGEQQ